MESTGLSDEYLEIVFEPDDLRQLGPLLGLSVQAAPFPRSGTVSECGHIEAYDVIPKIDILIGSNDRPRGVAQLQARTPNANGLAFDTNSSANANLGWD